MKNKKGISIGRILLYVLFLALVVVFAWTLYLTFKATREKIPTNTNDDLIKLVQNNDVTPVRNLYNKSMYPFQNHNGSVDDSVRAWTGAYIFLPVGTYSLTIDSGFYSNGYDFRILGRALPALVVDENNPLIFNSGYISSSTYTFTLTDSCYIGFYSSRSGGANIDYLNNLNIMLVEGSTPQAYISYDSNFDNAINYIDKVYFSGYLHNISGTGSNGNTYDSFDVRDYLPFTTTPYSTNKDTYRSNKTYYNLTTYNSNDLYVGYSYNTLFSSLYNNTYSADYWYSYNSSRLITGLSYNDSLRDVVAYYTTTNPIPVSLFNFSIYDSIQPGSLFVFHINGNDNISFNVSVNSASHFSYESLIDINANLKYISSFSITYHVGSILIASYASSSSVHFVFDNFYGNDQWLLGYQAGYAEGVANADSSLVNQNVELQNTIADLTSDILNLNSRVNQQSIIIDQLNNELQTSSNNFKGLFFTFADIPFKTVSNALGFEFWGINLFRFFVGIITALGILWLIKRLYK